MRVGVVKHGGNRFGIYIGSCWEELIHRSTFSSHLKNDKALLSEYTITCNTHICHDRA